MIGKVYDEYLYLYAREQIPTKNQFTSNDMTLYDTK